MVQCNGMRHKILRVRPSLQPALRPREARFLATRFIRLAAPVISSSRNKRKGATTSAIRGSEVRNQFMAWRNCISSAAVSGRLISDKPCKRTGSCDTPPVSTPYHTTRSHGRKRYTCEQPQTIPHSLNCLLYTSPSPRDLSTSRMPSSA